MNIVKNHLHETQLIKATSCCLVMWQMMMCSSLVYMTAMF